MAPQAPPPARSHPAFPYSPAPCAGGARRAERGRRAARRARDDVLWLFFEDMKEDLAGAVARVAEFTGAGAGAGAGGAARRALAAERSGFEFMRAHASQARARPRINHPPRAPPAGGALSVPPRAPSCSFAV